MRLKASRVLLTSDDGTPIALVIENIITLDGKAHFRVFRAGDSDFQSQLRNHGIDKTVLVTKLDVANKS